MRRLVGADLRGDDRWSNGTPSAPSTRRSGRGRSWRGSRAASRGRAALRALAAPPGRRPAGQRLRERARLALGQLDALLLREPLERDREHFAVGADGVGLDLRLELVVALEQRVGASYAEQPRELAADPAVPVDQRAVAVEGRPARSASLTSAQPASRLRAAVSATGRAPAPEIRSPRRQPSKGAPGLLPTTSVFGTAVDVSVPNPAAGLSRRSARSTIARVVPAEAERVRHARSATSAFARLVRDVVEVALRIRRLVVDRRRQHAVVTARIVKIASTAPAAPRQWPVAPLVDEIGVLRAFSSPSASLITRVSAASPIGVEVPCALM